jgi:predicted dehydrogenase
MSESTYKVGIIGLGFIGAADQVSGDALGQTVVSLDGTHLVALQNHARVEIIAGSSRDAGRRKRFTERTGIEKTYESWQEMIDQEEFDIVSVATYAPYHAEITAACARRGIRAIYCEKPVATRLSDAERMLAACREAGSLLAVNHNRRFNPNHRRLRDLLTTNPLGDLTSVSMQWGNGRLGNVATHFFDGLQMLLGRPIEAVSGTLDLAGKPDCRGSEFSDPGGWGVLRLQGNLHATVDAPDYGRTSASTIINGVEGRAIIAGLDVTLEYWDGRMEHWPNIDEGSSMDRAVCEIVDWLDGKPFPYEAQEAVHTLAAIVAFHASDARNGAWVDLPLQGADREIEVHSG